MCEALTHYAQRFTDMPGESIIDGTQLSKSDFFFALFAEFPPLPQMRTDINYC